MKDHVSRSRSWEGGNGGAAAVVYCLVGRRDVDQIDAQGASRGLGPIASLLSYRPGRHRTWAPHRGCHGSGPAPRRSHPMGACGAKPSGMAAIAWHGCIRLRCRLFQHRKSKQLIARPHDQILAPIEFVGHGPVGDGNSKSRMPQRRARFGVISDQVSA